MDCRIGVSTSVYPALVEDLAQGLEHLAALEECLFHTFVDDKVDITLAIAQFGIVEGIVYGTVLHFTIGSGLRLFDSR
jgi:hypothetical protein